MVCACVRSARQHIIQGTAWLCSPARRSNTIFSINLNSSARPMRRRPCMSVCGLLGATVRQECDSRIMICVLIYCPQMKLDQL